MARAVQQRKLQWYENPLGETPCRFESGPRHDSLPLCRVQGSQAVDRDVRLDTLVSVSADAQLAQRYCWRPNLAFSEDTYVSKARDGQPERRVARQDRRAYSRRRNPSDAPSAVERLDGVDPYNTGSVPVLDPAERSKRRSLDDMRELSEVIKTIRPPK
jgi:hypothetical protein